MGVLANHVPSIEQLKPGLVEVIEESGGSKQFFCTLELGPTIYRKASDYMETDTLHSVWRFCSRPTRLCSQYQRR